MGNLKNIPTDIVVDILTRLPAESILDLKLVCKPWRNLVSHHPSFYRMYLMHLNQSADSGKLSFIVLGNDEHLYHFEYNENHHDGIPTHNIRRIILTPPFTFSFDYKTIGSTGYKVIGSINGLVCLRGSGDYCICNPVTREYVMLPKLDWFIHCSSGFGYLPSTNEYKIVVLYTLEMLEMQLDFIEVAVYTLGSAKGWRKFGRLDLQLYKEGYAAYGVFLNGALHWAEVGGGRFFLFDLAEEKFYKHVSKPPRGSIFYHHSIGVLGGVLYYAIEYDRQTTQLWLLNGKMDTSDMKEQLEDEPLGWSKAFNLPGKEPLAFTKSGGVLCFGYGSIDIYDAATSTSENLMDFSNFSQIFSHKNTLVSLKELGEGGIKVMKTVEIGETETRDLLTKQLAR